MCRFLMQSINAKKEQEPQNSQKIHNRKRKELKNSQKFTAIYLKSIFLQWLQTLWLLFMSTRWPLVASLIKK